MQLALKTANSCIQLGAKTMFKNIAACTTMTGKINICKI